jgi:flavin reductase (DIM6/NTAB) family NADH-FMN oxidoreductase RutF
MRSSLHQPRARRARVDTGELPKNLTVPYQAAPAALLKGRSMLKEVPTAGTAPDVSAFRTAMGSFPTGVTVVTVASDDGTMHGITVNSFSSVSLDPMLVLVCLNETSRGLRLIERAGAFVVNVLSAGQQDVSHWFADRHRPVGSTMFDGVPFETGVTGCPVLAGATASFDCRLRQSHPAGDHLIVLGEVVAVVHRPHLQPLIFHAGTYKSLQDEPSRVAGFAHLGSHPGSDRLRAIPDCPRRPRPHFPAAGAFACPLVPGSGRLSPR